MSDQMVVKFWGVRGSYPVAGSAALRFGGNTPCVEVRANGQVIILDAGTGIVGLGRALARESQAAGKPVKATVLFSHMHHDHTQGLPFFAPMFMGTARLHLLGPGVTHYDFAHVLSRIMEPPLFPLQLAETHAMKQVFALRENEMALLNGAGELEMRPASQTLAHSDEYIVIRAMRSYAHPNGGVMFYRVEWREQAVVYATDTEGYAHGDQRLARFAQGADLLIHDTQYTDAHYTGQSPFMTTMQGFGHSTPAMACEVARAAGVKRLALFHFDPNYDDEAVARIEAEVRGCFPSAFAAYDGLALELGALCREQ